MKVKELIEELQKCNQDLDVVIECYEGYDSFRYETVEYAYEVGKYYGRCEDTGYVARKRDCVLISEQENNYIMAEQDKVIRCHEKTCNEKCIHNAICSNCGKGVILGKNYCGFADTWVTKAWITPYCPYCGSAMLNLNKECD